MSEQLQSLTKSLLPVLGSSGYAVVVDGMPWLHSGTPLYVEDPHTGKGEVNFFIKNRIQGKSIPITMPGASEALAKYIYSFDFFGYNFRSWFMEYTKGQLPELTVVAKPSLGCVFIETPMFTIFRTQVASKENLNITFMPKAEGNKELNQLELAYLLNMMRIHGVRSLVALYNAGLKSRIKQRSNPFYRIGDAFVPAKIVSEGIYNPFFEDRMLYNIIKDTKIMQVINYHAKSLPAIGIHTSYVSVAEICECLNLPELVPFDFVRFIEILAGQVLDLTTLPIDLPNRQKDVVRLNNPDVDMPRVLSAQEYFELSESERENYNPSNSMYTYLLTNINFYQTKGYRRGIGSLRDAMYELVVS